MAECSASSSSWSNVSSANQRYRDLDTAAMHFWIDKRGAVPHHGHGRYSHRVSASLASSRLPPGAGAAPQRRRRPSRSSSSRTNAAKATTPAVHRDRERAGAGDASTSGTTTATTTALTASSLAAGSGPSSGASRRVGGAAPILAPAPLLARAARAHLALPRPRPHLAYIGSTGSGIRAHGHGGQGPGGGGLGGMLVDLPLEGGHGALGASASGSDRADMFGLGALPLPVHGESPPVLMDRFTCGLWASFALASVFVAGTKFYLDFQSSGMEAMVLSLLLMIFLMVGCTASICRARVNSQLAAAAAAATASALRGDTGPSGLRRTRLGDSDELVVSEVVIDRPPMSMGMENVPCVALASGQQTQQHQLLQQVQQEQLAEQQLSTEPPPPYHIAMLDEQPPPAYEKVVT